MLTVVAYDVSDDRRRNQLREELENFGPRIQRSVFEMDITPGELEIMRGKVEKIVSQTEDQVRIYRLCSHCWGNVEIIGPGEVSRDPEVFIL